MQARQGAAIKYMTSRLIAPSMIDEEVPFELSLRPKLAVTILSGGSVEDLVRAIKRSDLARLTAIPGVGKKTGERIILELKDKLQDFAEAPQKPSVEVDVMSALENLGYNRAIAESAIGRAANGDKDPAFDVLFKRALQILTKG